jgi:hypothetical protein
MNTSLREQPSVPWHHRRNLKCDVRKVMAWQGSNKTDFLEQRVTNNTHYYNCYIMFLGQPHANVS